MTGTGKEYATALFALAQENNSVEAVEKGLVFLKATFDATPEYVAFLASPAVPKQERLQTITDSFAGAVPEYVASFLSLLCEHGDIRIFDDCVQEYEQLYLDSIRLSRATVCSAVELTSAQMDTLRAKLEKISGHRVEITCTVDPELLGGMTVEMDGMYLDGSLKHRLQNVKEVMDK